MTTADVALGISDADYRAQLRIAVLGSTVGAIIVSSDVLLYSSMAGLVFGRLFFLQSDPLGAFCRPSASSCSDLLHAR
jgi:hypothetical protein